MTNSIHKNSRGAHYSQRYKVNLAREQVDCERSYWMLSKLLPKDMEQSYEFSIPLARGNHLDVHIDLLQKTRFTRVLRIRQSNPDFESPLASTSSGLDIAFSDKLRLFLEMEVRVYDDVSMAEVICWQKNRCIKPRYSYPNTTMYQPNEKAQQNRFLADWLAYCVEKGISKNPVVLPTEV